MQTEKLSFEHISASISCQDFVNKVLIEYLVIFVVAYLNDELIYSDHLSRHVGVLTKPYRGLINVMLLVKRKNVNLVLIFRVFI